jgi:hypothetical protein
MNLIRSHLIVAFGIMALLGKHAAAEPRTGADMYDGPCVAELHAYCANVLEGQGRQLNCLAAHLESLKPGCRAMLVQRGAIAPQMLEREASIPDHQGRSLQRRSRPKTPAQNDEAQPAAATALVTNTTLSITVTQMLERLPDTERREDWSRWASYLLPI